MAHDCLLGILQELAKVDFESFQWYLEKDSNGAIKKYHVECANSREKTVDLIMQTYPDSAVEVTKILLERIRRHDLARSLSGAAGSGSNGN